MDSIELRRVSHGRGGPTLVEPFVNGASLRVLATAAEAPYAAAEGETAVGDHVGLDLAVVGDVRSHYLGSPTLTWFGEGDTVVLGCGCGAWECWPLTCDIAIGQLTVTWSGFRNGHRDWDLGAIGPFVFNRKLYEAAVEMIMPSWR